MTQTPTAHKHRFSEDLAKLQQYEKLSLQQLLDHMHGKGVFLATFFLTIPFIQPLPMFGLSTVFGFVILFNNFAIATTGKPWIPKFLGEKIISKHMLTVLDKAAVTTFEVIEKFSKPRGKLFQKHPLTSRTSAFLITLNAFLLSLPLPIPASNMIPALSIILITVGTIEEDSYATILGYLMTIVCIGFFASIPFLFFELLSRSDTFMTILGYIKNIL